jgi:uncharacterized membrane protein
MDGTIFLVVMAIVLGIMVLPVTILVLVAKLAQGQKDAANTASQDLESLRLELRDQKRLLQRLVHQGPSTAPKPLATQEEAMPVEPFEEAVEPFVPKPSTPKPPIHAPAPPKPSPLVPAATGPATSVPKSSAPKPRPEIVVANAIKSTQPPLAREVPPAREPSQFETAAKKILSGIWNWIVVGEEHRPAGVSMEYAMASTWLLRLGVLILVVGIGFFLKYSIDRGFIGPMGRVGLSILAGVVMLASGMMLLGKKYHAFGQGLIGGGIAILYLSIFMAFNIFHMIEMVTAFALMMFITVCAGGMAIRFNSMLVAILGILGGYGTPIMLSTGVVNFVGLFSYVLMLGCGVLGISYKKNWHLLNYLSFIGTYVLFFGSMRAYQVDDFWKVMPFLSAFFVLFSTMVFLFNLINRTKSTLLESLGLLINAGIYFAVSYRLVDQALGYRWVAVVSLALAAFYVAHVWFFLIRKLLDRELLFCFCGLAAFFLAVTMPLVLSSEWITVSWAIQAFVMLWIAGKLKSEFLRQVAYLLYLIVLGRFCLLDLRIQYASGALLDTSIPLMEYAWHMLQRLVVFGIPIASLAGAFRLLRSPLAPAALAIDKANDMAEWIRHRWAAVLVVVVVAAMLFVFLHLELNRTFLYLFPPLRWPALSLLWIALCAWVLYEYHARPNPALLGVLMLLVCGLLVKLFAFDLMSWNIYGLMLYGGDYSFLEASMRLLDFGMIIAFLYCGFRLLQGSDDAKLARQLAGYCGLGLLFVFLSLEVNTYLFNFVRDLRPGGVSILWSLFAIGVLLTGIIKDVRPLRYIALGLFAIVAWKVFFSDLAHLTQIYRIVAFIILGIVVLSGSFIYLKYRQTFVTKTLPPEEKEP